MHYLCTRKSEVKPIKKKKAMEKILKTLSENNGSYIFDEDTNIMLFNDDTEQELGECFRVVGLRQIDDRIFVYVDCEDGEWDIEDLNDYEIKLIEENL